MSDSGRAISRGRAMALLAMIAEQSGENISKPRLSFVLDRLDDADPEKLEMALTTILETARRFPTVAEIKSAMGQGAASSQDHGRAIADGIWKAIGKFGELQPGYTKGAHRIEHALGSAAWRVVCNMGGWNTVVQMASEKAGIFRAQVRDTAESYIRTGQIEPQTPPILMAGFAALNLAQLQKLPDHETSKPRQTLSPIFEGALPPKPELVVSDEERKQKLDDLMKGNFNFGEREADA